MARRIRTCPVCGAGNDDLAIVCTSCKSYIQAKVDTLDLFHTLWGLLESPSRTFRRIALSGSKNYVLLLSILLGIAWSYAYLWKTTAGVVFPQLGVILGIGLAAGIPLGIVLAMLLAVGCMIGTHIAGGGLSFRNAYAVVAYAAAPVAASLVLVFPLEIAVFGIYLFDNNPSPWVLNPAAFAILAGLDLLALLWSIALLAIGLQSVASVGRGAGLLLALLFPVLLGVLMLVRVW